MINKKISTQPYKGTSDSYPNDMVIRNYLFNIWKETAYEFGYEEYDTPLIENVEIYKAKSGDAIAFDELYEFQDKSGRKIALRPEMTPSLARIIASKINELPKPIRWFNIGNYYRYEKPQRGRSREFSQLNIDILGIDNITAEFEILQYIESVMNKLKADKKTYKIFINSRKLLDYLFIDLLNLNPEQKKKLGRILDNYSKISSDEFYSRIKKIGFIKSQVDIIDRFLKLDIAQLRKLSRKVKGAGELVHLIDLLRSTGIKTVQFKPYIMRGFDYYTGIVLELFDTGSKKNPRALFGGGRYDDLLEIFGKQKLPAFGIGWGNIPTLDYMKTYNLLPSIKTNTQVFALYMDDNSFIRTSELIKNLRRQGITVEQQLCKAKIQKQMEYANKKGIKWILINGEDEIKNNQVSLKDMVSGKQILINPDKISEKINL